MDHLEHIFHGESSFMIFGMTISFAFNVVGYRESTNRREIAQGLHDDTFNRFRHWENDGNFSRLILSKILLLHLTHRDTNTVDCTVNLSTNNH